MSDEDFVAWLASDDRIIVILVEAAVRVDGAETTFYLSSRNYVTGAGDSPGNLAYDACIDEGSLPMKESLAIEGSQPQISFGDIRIDNTGGARDEWLGDNYVWCNRQVRVYAGDPRWERGDFRLVYDGVAADLDTSDAEQLNLHLLDKLQRLNFPLTEQVLGGTSANKDRLIPLTFGECFNVEPLLTNKATLEYQVHDGRIEDVIEVRSNGGVPVSVTENLAAGKFTLNQAPANTTITVSVQGHKPGSPAAYSNDIASLIEEIATGYGPADHRFDSGDLDAANLAAFALANPQPVGLFASDRMTVIGACQMLASSVGAQVVVNTLGQLRLVQLDLPVPVTSPSTAIEVTADDIEEYHSLRVTSRLPVKAAVKIGFCRNWTVQEALATGLPQESAVLFKQEWRTVTSSDAGVASVYKLDVEPEMEETLLLDETDAEDEADRRLAMWSEPRHIYTATYGAHLLLTELGDAVTVTHDRFGLSGGKTGMVVHIERDWFKGEIVLGVLA